MLGLAFSKTQEFLCFHTSQETKIISELSPFLIPFGTALRALFHHKEKRVSEAEGVRSDR